MKELVEAVLKKHYGLQKAKKEFYEPFRTAPNERILAEWSGVGADVIVQITEDLERMTGEQFIIGRKQERNLLESSETTRQQPE